MSAVGMGLDHEIVCIPIERVREIIAAVTNIVPVPGAPAAVIGLINVHGIAVALLDTRRLLGMSPLTSHPFAVVAQVDGGDAVAFATSEIPGHLRLGPPLRDGDQPGITEVRAESGGRLVGLLDVDKLLASGLRP